MIWLITGASHTGKTLLAQRMLERYSCPYLSIDHLKMGLIRSGRTDLTPEDDEALTAYLWPIVREMIKTAAENAQSLIVEGCYVPFTWRRDFEEPYLSSIRYICLTMSDEYIDAHFDEIRAHGSEIEKRLDGDAGLTADRLKRENRAFIEGCRRSGEPLTLIEADYEGTIAALLRSEDAAQKGGGAGVLETERLLLRPWEETDAEECYRYARDPLVGPICGWPPHTDTAHSRRVIRDILSVPETYAIVWKETGLPVGSVGLHFHSDLAAKDDEAELGYWLGVPYWGRGIMPEAARRLLRHAFEDLGLARVWCGYFEGNGKSKRVQEKLGFRHHWTSDNVPVPQMGEMRKGYVNLLTREDWLAKYGAGAADEKGGPDGDPA